MEARVISVNPGIKTLGEINHPFSLLSLSRRQNVAPHVFESAEKPVHRPLMLSLFLAIGRFLTRR